MLSSTLFKSNTVEWSTPQWLFDKLNTHYKFTLDVCASHNNAKCTRYFTMEDDGLTKDWTNNICWMNPPYGKDIGKWVKKAHETMLNGGKVIALLPVRTDTKWWYTHVKGVCVEFIKGRLKFGNSLNNAPFPSCIVYYTITHEYNYFENVNIDQWKP